jgi:pSer/pThr/pTyr-binding forkhead associated (FHA) protein
MCLHDGHDQPTDRPVGDVNSPYLQIDSHWFPLRRSVTVVGRAARGAISAPDLDLTPFDPRRVTSRRHAELRCADGAVYLRDLGSKNGTEVGGRRLLPEDQVTLGDGDRVSFAGVQARFVREKGDEAGPPPEDGNGTVVSLWPRPLPQPNPAQGFWRTLLHHLRLR